MLEELDLSSFGLIVLSGFLGAMVGIERELADKPAGLRTHIFVAAGSTLLVLLSSRAMEFLQQTNANGNFESDPIRIIQAIVVGISFLGAGTIVHHGSKHVEGLTTAATIFLTSGIGIAVALRSIALAIETTLFALLVLIVVQRFERRLPGNNDDS